MRGANLDGNRRIAGMLSSVFDDVLSFNTSVPGTCYLVVGLAQEEYMTNPEVNLHFQYKGLTAKWNHITENKRSLMIYVS